MLPVYKNALCLLTVLTAIHGCTSDERVASTPAPCSAEWNDYVDTMLTTDDGMGHGPDIGSDEWKSVVEFRLGVRGIPGTPDRSSEDWCTYIDAHIRQ